MNIAKITTLRITADFLPSAVSTIALSHGSFVQ